MSNFVLSACSTADLSKEHFESRGIEYICFHYFMDDVEYMDDLGQTIPFDEFYKRMSEGADTRTAQVNISEYLDHFESILSRGQDILHVCLSSGISGSYNSACNAALIAAERYPERKIYVVDSLAASSGFGLLVDKLADLRDEGKSIDEVHAWAEENKLNLQIWFLSTDLTFFVKGGRISKASGVFGGLLNICPLMNMDTEGHLVPRVKVRGKKKVLQEIVKRMEEFAADGYDYSDKCYMCQSACMEDAREVADAIEEKFPKMKEKVLINNIGTVIGSHTGPGTIAIFFWGDRRAE